jgi:hypothetical protein
VRLFILILFMVVSSMAGASTFVGNGGNAGDVELEVTVRQVQQTFSAIAKEKAEKKSKLCVCTSEFQGRPLCELLKRLNEEQAQFCANYIREKAPQLAEALGEKEKLKISWTNDPIEVEEGGSLRGADAVTRVQNMTMMINQQRYMAMSDVDRVFLMSHELFHLTSYNGKTLTDEGDIGPFKGVDGGRRFINAMAASLVMQTSENDLFDKYRGAINRSKGYKKFWINADIVSSSTDKDGNSPYYITQHTGGRFGFRYQLTDALGVLAEYSVLQGEKSILTTIKGKETKNIVSLGVAYRWFPFENPLTFAGQSHLVFRGKLDLISARYQLNDPYVGIDDSASTKGSTLDCNYFIPFAVGLWGYGGIGYSTQQYKFEKLNLEYKNSGLSVMTGVSYGF